MTARARLRTSDSRLVATLSVTTTVSYGVLFYAYGVLLLPIEQDTGWSRTFLSGAFSAGLLISALSAVPVGRRLDRHPARPLLLAGAATAVVLLVAWAGARDRLTYVGVWLALGICQAILFYEPAFIVLTKRFHGAARNRAITNVTLLAGFASTIFGPLTAMLEGHLGWRTTVVVLAVVLGAVVVPALLLGLRPASATVAEVASSPGVMPAAALRTRAFWLLCAAYLLSAITTFGVAVHLVPFLRDRGTATGVAASVLGAIGVVQVLGRATFIRLSARRPSVHLATWVLALKATGLALLLAINGLLGVVLFVVVYGAANGLSTLTRATTIGELYGHEHYGAISAVIASVTAVAGALAPFAVAAAADVVGSLTPVLACLAALTGFAALANEAVAHPTRAARRALIST